MGAPTSSYATAGIALRISGALKPHHHDKVETPSVGPLRFYHFKFQVTSAAITIALIILQDFCLGQNFIYCSSETVFSPSGFLCSFFDVSHGKQSSKDFSQNENFSEATVQEAKERIERRESKR
jgi:hypothetical protein